MLRIDSEGHLMESKGFGGLTRILSGDMQIIRSKFIKEGQELEIFNDFGDEVETKWWVKLSDGELKIRPLPAGWRLCLEG